MSTKQVILAKTEYDAMEEELNDLRTIVASRQVVTIVEENLNWRLTYATASGTRIKYIVWDDKDAIKNLADQVDCVQKELENTKQELYTAHIESGRKSDEINRLNKQTWYQKLFSKNKKIIYEV